MFERILVAVDGSAPAKRAFDLALDVAKAQEAKLYALHVIDERALGIGLVASGYVAPAYVEGLIDGLRKVGKKILVGVQRRAKASGQPMEALLIESLGGDVAHTILAQARKVKADLIVLGTHGRRGVARIVMGSDTETVVREANVPVLLARTFVRKKAAPRGRRHR